MLPLTVDTPVKEEEAGAAERQRGSAANWLSVPNPAGTIPYSHSRLESVNYRYNHILSRKIWSDGILQSKGAICSRIYLPDFFKKSFEIHLHRSGIIHLHQQGPAG